MNLLEITKQLIVENPNTLDSIYIFIGIGIVSIIAIIIIINKMNKDKNAK